MTEKELLEKYYELEMDIIFDNSENYKMNSPKKGREEIWEDAYIRADMLKGMIERAG